jgi:ABC-type ATPase with predicted acetyltransferase domain
MKAIKKKYNKGGEIKSTKNGDPNFEKYLRKKAKDQVNSYVNPLPVRSHGVPKALLEKRWKEIRSMKDPVEYLMNDKEFRSRVKSEYEKNKPSAAKAAKMPSGNLNVASALKKKKG